LYIKGKSAAPNSEVNVFDSKMDLKNILQSIAKWLKVSSKEMANLVVPEFYPLPFDLIIPGWFCATEIFKKQNETYETLFKPDDVILSETLDVLEAEQVELLYVRSENRIRFVNSLTNQISSKLADPTLTYQERLKVTATGYQMVMEQARKLGISEGAMELTNKCITSMEKLVDDTPTVAKLLEDLLTQKSSYRYKHCLLICYIGSHIIQKMNWGTLEQRSKLVFVTFFHDIILTSDEMAKISSDEELEKSSLSDKDKKLVKYHAILAAKIVSKVSKAPIGADTIIKQHHGSRNGDNLSQLSQVISPLAIVFIIAEEWTHHVLEKENDFQSFSREDFLVHINKKYKLPAFYKILPVLDTLDF